MLLMFNLREPLDSVNGSFFVNGSLRPQQGGEFSERVDAGREGAARCTRGRVRSPELRTGALGEDLGRPLSALKSRLDNSRTKARRPDGGLSQRAKTPM
jgi:hypothetical protein